jgi:hypothetical protein
LIPSERGDTSNCASMNACHHIERLLCRDGFDQVSSMVNQLKQQPESTLRELSGKHINVSARAAPLKTLPIRQNTKIAARFGIEKTDRGTMDNEPKNLVGTWHLPEIPPGQRTSSRTNTRCACIAAWVMLRITKLHINPATKQRAALNSTKQTKRRQTL